MAPVFIALRVARGTRRLASAQGHGDTEGKTRAHLCAAGVATKAPSCLGTRFHELVFPLF